MKPSWLTVYISPLLHASHSSQLLSVRRLATDNLSSCPRYSQNPFYSLANLSYSAKAESKMASRGTNDGTMMAAVIYEAGGPEVFKVVKRPVPKPVRDY